MGSEEGVGVRGAHSNDTLLTKNCTTFETMVLNFSSLFQKGDFYFIFFLMWLLMSFVFSVLYLKVLKQYTRVLMVLLIV